MIGLSARRLARRIRPYGLELVRPDGQRRRYGSGDMATISGPASEMVLYLSGRRTAARVTLEGVLAAVDTVERTKLAV